MSLLDAFQAAANAKIAPFEIRLLTPAYENDPIKYRFFTSEGEAIGREFETTARKLALQFTRQVGLVPSRLRSLGYDSTTGRP